MFLAAVSGAAFSLFVLLACFAWARHRVLSMAFLAVACGVLAAGQQVG